MPWLSMFASIASGKAWYLARWANLSGFCNSIGLNEIVVAGGIYLAGAFTLAVAVVRLSPRGCSTRLSK